MSMFMAIVKQAAEVAKGRGRLVFVLDLEKWLPGRPKQMQPEEAWTVRHEPTEGPTRFEMSGADAMDALVALVAALRRAAKAEPSG